MKERILVVEDDVRIGAQIVEALTAEEFTVDWDQDGDAAVKRDPRGYDLIVLDLMLPGTYGLDVLKRFRARADVPVLILSAREDTGDKVRALKLGADDYMTKPFFPEELVARVRARLRRPVLERTGAGVLRAAGFTVDPVARTVRTDALGEIELTRVEFEIVTLLVRRAGSAITRAALVEAALDKEQGGHERTLDVHVSRLRKKLGVLGEQIKTVWGIGYKLVDEASESEA